jgi:hypothetical protein
MDITIACILLFWLIMFVILTATMAQQCKLPDISENMVGGLGYKKHNTVGNPLIYGGRNDVDSRDYRHDSRDYRHDFKRDTIYTDNREPCINYENTAQYVVPPERTF